MRHLYECPMRWADLDMLGHVNNVVYIDYLQEARVDMLRVHARSPRTDGLVEGTVVVSHQVTYVAPLLFDFQPVLIECWVTEIRAATFTMAYEVFQEGDGERTVHLRATTVLSPYVFATESPRRLTADEKTALEPYLEPAPVPKVEFSEPRRLEVGRYPLKVRFSDVDAYGHVNNVKYFEYLQEARIDMFQKVLGSRDGRHGRPPVVVAQADVTYSRPLLSRPEPYEVWSWPSRLGRKSHVVEAQITDPLDGDRVLARGRTVLVFFDRATGRSIEPEESIRTALGELL